MKFYSVNQTSNGNRTNAGRNIAVITYDLEAAPGSPYNNSDKYRDTPEELLNTSTLKSYANIEGGQDFPASADNANVSASLNKYCDRFIYSFCI